jgi:hypothetical protein
VEIRYSNQSKKHPSDSPDPLKYLAAQHPFHKETGGHQMGKNRKIAKEPCHIFVKLTYDVVLTHQSLNMVYTDCLYDRLLKE